MVHVILSDWWELILIEDGGKQGKEAYLSSIILPLITGLVLL